MKVSVATASSSTSSAASSAPITLADGFSGSAICCPTAKAILLVPELVTVKIQAALDRLHGEVLGERGIDQAEPS